MSLSNKPETDPGKNNTHWFEEWFDSPLYEKLYSYRDEDEANKLADLIEELVPRSNYKKILDLGCGRGRHSLTLAERGYDVTGTDLSPKAIKKAKLLAAERNLNNVHFEVRDMREVLPNRFDAVLNLFTTFGYFLDDEENASVFDGVHKMLGENGRFLIDFLNAAKVEEGLVPAESGSYENLDYQIERFIADGMVHKKIRFTGAGLKGPVEYQERVKLYGKDWFEPQLKARGFNILDFKGDYSGRRFSEEISPRLIILAEKRV